MRPTSALLNGRRIILSESAEAVGCERFILSGSLEEPSSHDSEVVPSSPYAVTKWASSPYARMFHALYQFQR
jgi:nucleoside-diphosphate-sugar epimerase